MSETEGRCPAVQLVTDLCTSTKITILMSQCIGKCQLTNHKLICMQNNENTRLTREMRPSKGMHHRHYTSFLGMFLQQRELQRVYTSMYQCWRKMVNSSKKQTWLEYKSTFYLMCLVLTHCYAVAMFSVVSMWLQKVDTLLIRCLDMALVNFMITHHSTVQ